MINKEKMLKFLKKNGAPVDLIFKTEPHEIKNEGWKGYKSEIFLNRNYLDTLYHSKLSDRGIYAGAVFKTYKFYENQIFLDNFKKTKK